MRKIAKILKVVILTLVGCCVVAIGIFVYEMEHPSIGKDREKLSGFPASGRHYYYKLSPFYRGVYFRISPTDFNTWIAAKGFENKGYEGLCGADGVGFSKSIIVSIDENTKFSGSFDNGIWIMNRGNNGGGYTIGYDQDNQACFYTWSSH